MPQLSKIFSFSWFLFQHWTILLISSSFLVFHNSKLILASFENSLLSFNCSGCIRWLIKAITTNVVVTKLITVIILRITKFSAFCAIWIKYSIRVIVPSQQNVSFFASQTVLASIPVASARPFTSEVLRIWWRQWLHLLLAHVTENEFTTIAVWVFSLVQSKRMILRARHRNTFLNF